MLQELAREEGIKLSSSLIGLTSSSAIPIVRGPGDTVDYTLHQLGRDQALLMYQQLGSTLYPWDDSWREKMKETKSRIKQITHEIGDTGITDEAIVDMISEYEKLKQQRTAKNEPNRPTNA